MNILKGSNKQQADLIAECYCGAIFEFQYRELRAEYSSGTTGHYYAPVGGLVVSCPSCAAGVRVGSYELSKCTPGNSFELRKKLDPPAGSMTQLKEE